MGVEMYHARDVSEGRFDGKFQSSMASWQLLHGILHGAWRGWLVCLFSNTKLL